MNYIPMFITHYDIPPIEVIELYKPQFQSGKYNRYKLRKNAKKHQRKRKTCR